MTKIMTPSAEQKEMTGGQIEKAVANYRALLMKHASEFSSETAQTVLGQPELAREMFEVFRKRAEAISSMIFRDVEVDRSKTPQQLLDATGRTQYIDHSVVDAMPRGKGDKVKLGFFKLDLSDRGGIISDDDLAKEFALRNLEPDPCALAAYNAAELAFADEHPNGTHWKDADGKWCFVAFDRWLGDERSVNVNRSDDGWDGYWWFGGASM